MRTRFLFGAGRKAHRFEVLEIGPQGFRLLVPRRALIFAVGATLAVGYFVGFQSLISAAYALGPMSPRQNAWTMVLVIVSFGSGPAFFGWLATKTFAWIASLWPRRVIPLEFRAIEPHLLTHWLWVSAEGEETWVQVGGLRRRLTRALDRAGYGPRAANRAA